MSSLKIALRQARAEKVAEFALKQRMEKIEWEETVLKPHLEREAQRIGETLEIPVFAYLDEED